MRRPLSNDTADTLGMTASTACMVHCALTPLLLALAPGLAHYIPGDESVHRVLALVVLSAGGLALVRGYRVHRKIIVMVGFLAGAALVVTGAVVGDLLGSHVAEICVTIAGSSTMVASHWKNRAFCSACRKCSHE